jgi:hypothetical protein
MVVLQHLGDVPCRHDRSLLRIAIMSELADFSASSEPIEVARLVRRPGLITDVQARLAHHGLLDPPADGFLGPISQWAMSAFSRAAGQPFDGTLTPNLASALLRADPILPLRPDDSLGGRVVAAVTRQGHWLSRHPDCVNIVYVEGMDEQGRRVPRRPNAFDDLRLLLRIRPDGRAEIAGAWCATTASGRPAVEAPAEPEGAPRLALGQHRAWVVGRTAIGTGMEQEALVQVQSLSVTRDTDRNFQREGDQADTGIFLLDQHGGLDAPREDVGGIGAGCLVGRSQAGHRDFMAGLKEDPRWRANAAYRFTTTILRAESIV